MKGYGCIVCHVVRMWPDEMWIVPYCHPIYCAKHRPRDAIPYPDFMDVGESWANWRKMKLEQARAR